MPKSGVICTFPECNMALTTPKFMQDITRHLKGGALRGLPP
ncbi:hypothetical protein PF008_g17442 [Phytophthora fragariae]|uniref:Uncharacterized protein n=1 Tax=Phytophthora fragariae TaxID=53985 RepID=A0A6G0R9F9_9STRA|nr:hypothetical protein PF008_g17442 [Phytophthora fragariae]